MISLYRANGRDRDSQLIYEHSGSIVAQVTTTSRGSVEAERPSISVGAAENPATDTALAKHLSALVGLGYRVLYGFIPPGSLPKTERLLSERLGIETIPDVRDGLPIWRTTPTGRQRRPSYLLFTALSSEAK